MELREMIQAGETKSGSLSALARALDMHPNNLTNAKRGQRGIPPDACGKLADLIGIDRYTAIAASELVTEKNPARRAYYRPFVFGKNASVAAISAALSLVTLFVTPTPANAAARADAQCTNNLYYVNRWIKALRQIAALVRNSFSTETRNLHFEGS